VLNADLNTRVVVDTGAMAWSDTAQAGVWRKPLDQISSVAAATGVLKYAPGTLPSPPDGSVGEEIIVLEGVLADEHGDHATGTYLRAPPGVPHSLRCDAGCVLFVKRYEFDADDTDVVRLDTAHTPWLQGLISGLSVMPLHQHRHEHAALVRWQPETYFQPHAHFGGEEILVLEGVFEDEHGQYPAGTWIRGPHMSRHQPFSRTGCTIYVKTGHLQTDKNDSA